MARHHLKILREHFDEVLVGRLRAQWRKDDRRPAFGRDDVLELCEWDDEAQCFSGRVITARVTHVLRDRHQIPPGFAMLSIEVEGVGMADWLKNETGGSWRLRMGEG